MAPLRLPPNPFDRWARSESGLHMPSWMVPRAIRRTHHIGKNGSAQDCCSSQVVTCCGEDDFPATVPKYMTVEVTDMPSCAGLSDGTYVLTFTNVPGMYGCGYAYKSPLYDHDGLLISACRQLGECVQDYPPYIYFWYDDGSGWEYCIKHTSPENTNPNTWTSASPLVAGNVQCSCPSYPESCDFRATRFTCYH